MKVQGEVFENPPDTLRILAQQFLHGGRRAATERALEIGKLDNSYRRFDCASYVRTADLHSFNECRKRLGRSAGSVSVGRADRSRARRMLQCFVDSGRQRLQVL